MKTSKHNLERQNWKLRGQIADRSGTNSGANSGVNSTQSSNPTANLTDNPIAFLQTLWQGFVKTMTGGNELQVWQTSDIDGYLHWRAYDPVTQESVNCDSEDEMRVWIEQRYHHHPSAAVKRYHQQQYQLLPLRS